MTKSNLCVILDLQSEKKGVFKMFAVSMKSDLRKETSLVLPEPQYHVLLCLHSTKMEALNL